METPITREEMDYLQRPVEPWEIMMGGPRRDVCKECDFPLVNRGFQPMLCRFCRTEREREGAFRRSVRARTLHIEDALSTD